MNTDYGNNDSHWTNPPYPLKPCDAEVLEYKKYLIPGTTLLLGSTPQLIDLCDVALDIKPRISHHKIVQGDWYKLDKFYDNIITDGALNLTGPSLIDIVRPNCKQFISRTFSKKFSYMKYATYFYTEFPNATKVAEINESCPIFIWKFTN